MRIKVTGNIIEDEKTIRGNYNHEIYSMILSNLNTKTSKEIHKKERFKRLFTFSDLYIDEGIVHLYISGKDELIKDFIDNIVFNQIVKIGDKVIVITNITPIQSELEEKDYYIFKTKFIVNEKENNKVCLSKNNEYIKRRISEIINDKYEDMYGVRLDLGLDVELLKMKHVYTNYKNHHLNSYKALIKVSGNLKLINALYNLGIGENTASGHGFVWEV